MDHKVSKDMISSGMIPSGEKNQADLGRTQYGSAPSPSKLMDAYKSMYEHHKKDADGNTIPHEGEELNEVGFLAPLLGGLTGVAGKAAVGAGAKAAAAGATKAAAGMGTFGKAAAAGAGKSAGSTVMKGGIGKTITRAGIKMGGKTGGKIAKTMVDNPTSTYMIGKDIIPKGGGGASQSTIKKTGTVSASADLFDIVKGQLLDEGLSEEEIRDIMLTLTPDEIMEELSDIVKRNDALNLARAKESAKQKEVPQNIRDASKRQMKAGTPREDPKNPYTTQDKKDIINYNKNK